MKQTHTPRLIALDLLDKVLTDKVLLDDALESEPRLSKLDLRDRAFVRLLLSTTLRRLGQIDQMIGTCLEKPLVHKARRATHVLRLGICQLLFLKTPPHAAISTSVDALKGTQLAGFAKLINAVLRRVDREGGDWLAKQQAGRLNTPDWLWRGWVDAYGEPVAHAIAEAHMQEAALDITVTGDAAHWANVLDGMLLPTGSVRLKAGGDITALPGYQAGHWWVQDAAAAIPARLLGQVKGLRVADLCAAPGGKSMQLAAAGALVTAVDRSARRLDRLRRNTQRLGQTVEIVTADVAAWKPESLFDAALLDAPCSATGTLRRHPDGLHLKGPGDVAALADQQAVLLPAALAMLKPGGRLVYCVCSLEPEEGVRQIEALLAARSDVRRVPVTADELGGLGEWRTEQGDVRTLPCHLADAGGVDAFYAARLEKVG